MRVNTLHNDPLLVQHPSVVMDTRLSAIWYPVWNKFPFLIRNASEFKTHYFKTCPRKTDGCLMSGAEV